MTLESLTTINPQGGIQAHNTKTGADIYIAPGTVLHDLALAGTLGPVAPYVAPPKPEEPPEFPDKAAAMAALKAYIERFLAPITGAITAEEKVSWPVKEVAAIAYLAGTADASATAMIEGEAAVTTEDPSDLCDKILAEAETFRGLAAMIAGLRRKVSAALDAESDPHKYAAIIAAAEAEAVTLATALGAAEELGIE
ncbi:hypothetical protein [Roseovarius sp. C03]|uniref:hypothetical protein n=1 Tax=Roseovarius sp. C03 TaxID=3449222 RepID=UPI003EDC8D44